MSRPKPQKTRQLYTLWVHDNNFSAEELVINPECFPSETQVGDILEIYKQTNRDKRLYLRVGAITSVKANLQLSIKDSVAPTFELGNRDEVIANIVPRDSALLEFVELTFKDQLISRSDMWRLKLSLQNQCVYVNKNISFGSMRGQVKDLISGGSFVSSGLISDSTKFIFRSRSAEYILFFQMTKEMWDFAPEDGQLYFEKAVEGFLPQLFEKWQQTGANHSVTIIFFSRTYYSSQVLADSGSEAMSPEERGQLMTDWAGRLYHDFYLVIAQHERIVDLPELKRRLKQKFLEYPTFVNWNRASSLGVQGASSAIGENSSADTSNFLEAISLGQTMFDRRRYIDCDLTKSGQTIVVVSAGTGIYHVDAAMAQDVKQRMVDNGTGCDLVCLTKPPLHVVPLFVLHYLPSRFLPRAPPLNPQEGSATTGGFASAQSGQLNRKGPTNPQSSLSSSAARAGGVGSFSTSFNSSMNPLTSISENPSGQDIQQFYSHLPQGPVFKMAHWMFLFFWESARKEYGGDDPVDRLASAQTFVPSCRVPGLQFKPLMAPSEIVLPFRVSKKPTAASTTTESNRNRGTLSSSPSSPPDGSLSTLATVSFSSNPQQAMEEYDNKVFAVNTTDSHKPLSHSASVSQLSRNKSFASDSSSNLAALAATPAPTGLSKTRSVTNLDSIANNGTTPGTSKRASLRTSGLIPREADLPTTSFQTPRTSSTALTASGRNAKRPTSQASSPEMLQGQQLLQARAFAGSRGPAASPNKKLSSSATGIHSPQSINPFNHTPDAAPLPSSNRARWSHIFPRANMLQELFDSDSSGPHWKSLSQPGALPLTTGYMPTPAIFNKDFEEYPHTLAVIPEDCLYGDKVDDIFRELVSQRLLFGYQLVEISNAYGSDRLPSSQIPSVSVNSAAIAASMSTPAGSVLTAAASGGMVAAATSAAAAGPSSLDEKKKLRYVLSTGYSFHKLGFDELTQNVEVKRYHRKKAVAPQTRPLQYKYFLYALRSDHRLSRCSQLGYQALVHYKWNHIDQLIAGYVYDFFDSLIFWRLTLMLAPAQSSPAGVAAAAAGFEKFKEFLVQRIAKNVSDEEFSKIQITVVQPASTSSVPAMDPNATSPLESSNLRGILAGLTATFGERKSKSSSRSTPAGCHGSEGLDWIMRNVRGCNGNASATSLFTILLKSGYLTDLDASSTSSFDATHIYMLSDIAPAFIGSTKVTATAPSPQTQVPPVGASASQPQRNRQRTVRLEMDRSRTDRVEWVNLKYDSVFNPDIVFEMELQWLVGTGGVILDFVNALVRRAKSSGLVLQLIPTFVDQKASTPHPFFAPTSRPFHFARLSNEGKIDLVTSLTSKLDFLARKTQGQYVHRTGALLLEAKDDCFEWTINWADASVASAQQTVELIKRLNDALATLDVAPLDENGKIISSCYDALAPQPATLAASTEVPLSKSTAAIVREILPHALSVATESESTPVLSRSVKMPIPVPSDSAPTSPGTPAHHHHPHALHHPHVRRDDGNNQSLESIALKRSKKKVTFARNTNEQVYWYAGATGRPSVRSESDEKQV